MKIEIDFTKSIQENADDYYALSKKSKKKLNGLDAGVREVERKLIKQKKDGPKKKNLVKKRERKWFEKFHWFFTSEGFLVIAGKDAKTNEVIVKKLMEKNDVYFHADIHGAPHTVLKTEGKTPGDISKKEAAIFAAIFSKAWREQLSAVDVYSAKPEQVTKSAPSGESLGTGAFMVYGKREWFKKTPLEFSIGLTKGTDHFLSSGPISAVSKNSEYSIQLFFGNNSKGDTSKLLKKIFYDKSNFSASLDDIVALLPSGGFSIKKS